MGTHFEIVLPGTDRRRLTAAAEEAAVAIEDCHHQFTRFEASGLLGHLQRVAPAPVPVTTEDEAVFAAAERIRVASGGAFDPAMGRVPDGGYRLDQDDHTVAVPNAEIRLDFGAIGKGFAVDRAIERLREAEITAGFVHGGTSSARGFGARAGDDGYSLEGSGGPVARRAGWRVALTNGPVVTLRNQALSVSSTIATRNGEPAWHLLDPRTGLTITLRRRAAVLGPSAGWADGWSTAVLVAGARPAAMGSEWTVWVEEDGGPWQTIETAQ